MAALSTIASIAAIGAATGSIVASARQKVPRAPKFTDMPEAPDPVKEAAAVRQRATAVREQRKRQAAHQGRSTTMLTTKLGEPATERQTLLGY